MLGPYEACTNGRIRYKGNKISLPIDDISGIKFPTDEIESRVSNLATDTCWHHIARIGHRINMATHQYFDSLGALFTPLPLTTRMISSPGAVYGREAISYTTDTCPITLQWFDLKGPAFLSESSQIYLELALLQHNVEHVYSVYNSFRYEEADATHLSEFHHIEYEGRVSQERNIEIILHFMGYIIQELLRLNEEDIAFFVQYLDELSSLTQEKRVHKITFADALLSLYEDTGNEKYRKFTMEYLGSWEEIRLTQIYGGLVVITEFPLLEVPFYHAAVDNKEPKVANNADFILPGYRETVGSGHRVRSVQELEEKARIFQLPRNDYEPYLQSRIMPEYSPTSGFGLGWERFLQGILELPFIWSGVQFPRGHSTLKP